MVIMREKRFCHKKAQEAHESAKARKDVMAFGWLRLAGLALSGNCFFVFDEIWSCNSRLLVGVLGQDGLNYRQT